MECNKIVIGRPEIVQDGENARLESEVMFPGERSPKELWIEVDKKFGNKLVCDRLDGFLVWLLPYAMRNGFSIVCEAPVSRRLLYQLNHYLLYALSNFINEYKRIDIEAEGLSEPVSCNGGAATGWTGGVDSMYTLWKMFNFPIPEYRLTHLVVMSCGALEGGDNSGLVKTLSEDARQSIGKDTGLEIVRVDSNIEYLTPEPFLSVSDYRLVGVALCLQKLFSRFYISASYDFETTRFYADASCYYSLYSLPLLSTESMSLSPIGGALSRLEKIKRIADFHIAQKYLHPCIYIRRNCGHCDKCIRTETALYSIGKLENFKSVFDVGEFYRNKKWYLTRLLSLKENQHCAEILSELSKRVEKFDSDVIQQAKILNSARKIIAKNKEIIQSKLMAR